MHYYQFNIGDYRKDTGHLSLLEHGIYRSLIDSYYLNEGGLLADDANLMRTHSIRMDDAKEAYKNVISDFFTEVDGFYIHDKCEGVMGKIFEKSQKARESAKKRWEKCAKDANAMRTHSEGNANGMLPNTQYPITQLKDSAEFDLIWELYEKKGNKKTSKARFDRLSNAKKKLMAVHLPKYVESTPDKQFRKGLERYVLNECWNDEILENNNNDKINGGTYQTATDRARSDGQKLLDEQRAAQERNTNAEDYSLV